MGLSTARVIFSNAEKGVARAVAEVFEAFGGGRSMLRQSGDVYIKVNAVDLKPFCFTDPRVIAHTVSYFKDQGARNVYVMENCTQGNFTRLVFAGSGIGSACRRAGAIPVFLDETGLAPVYLAGIQGFVNISDFVFERLIQDREQNLYISLPKLKTHSMSQVTLSIKNQFGFVHQADRIADHNFRLHRKFADIYGVIRPDFVLVDGLVATNHGHYIATKNADKCVEQTRVLIGGADALAVDVVAADFLGFALSEVPHLALAAQMGIGQADMEQIEIVNKELFEARRRNFTHELLDRFPDDLLILRGRERCCPEGCRRNTETLVEILHCDYDGKGGFAVLMGKGIDPTVVDKLDGRVHIAGSCAIEEHALGLFRRLGEKNVTTSPGCNNLARSVEALTKQMKVNTLKLAGVNPLKSLALLAAAKINGSRAIIPRLW